jgi:hypothetical protein
MKYEVCKADYILGNAVFSCEVFEGFDELECLLSAQEKFGSIVSWKLLDEGNPAPSPEAAPVVTDQSPTP